MTQRRKPRTVPFTPVVVEEDQASPHVVKRSGSCAVSSCAHSTGVSTMRTSPGDRRSNRSEWQSMRATTTEQSSSMAFARCPDPPAIQVWSSRSAHQAPTSSVVSITCGLGKPMQARRHWCCTRHAISIDKVFESVSTELQAETAADRLPRTGGGPTTTQATETGSQSQPVRGGVRQDRPRGRSTPRATRAVARMEGEQPTRQRVAFDRESGKNKKEGEDE